jgi:peptidoglycan/LPS O-acetylase OafA/YrhL
MKIDYRPEIDGLRAIAVISVLIYHLKIKLHGINILSGGYLGVDIFFVISGYLITSIIYKDLESNNKFSFLDFYKRRARRIIPALIGVMLFSFPLAFLCLMPSEFVEFSKSILFSLGFFSNYYFLSTELQYGAQSSLLKPFLHTWSLSIEEQFYLIFPIFLFIIYRKFQNYIFYIILLVAIASLTISELTNSRNSLLSFYFIHTRAWELLTGSLLALSHFKYNKKLFKISKSSFFSLLGLILIIIPLFLYDENTRHPSIYTLIVIIGVSLVILFTVNKNFTQKLLSIKLVVFIGLISYSLYLWHFPIFSFVRIIEFTQSNLFRKIFVLFLVFIFSLSSYYLIEKPARNYLYDSKKVFLYLFISIIIIAGLNLSVIHKNGYPERIPDFIKNFQKDIDKPWKKLNSGSKSCYDNKEGCYFNVKSNKKIYLIGDSHAATIATQLKKDLVEKDYQFIFYHDIFFPGFKLVQNKTKKTLRSHSDNLLKKFLKENDATFIFLMRYPLYLTKKYFNNLEGGKEPVSEFDSSFVSDGKYKSIQQSFQMNVLELSKNNEIILIYPIPEVGWNVPSKLKNKFYIYKENFAKENYLTTSFLVYKERTKTSFEMLDTINNSSKIKRIFPDKIFCNKQFQNRCETHDHKNIFYSDDDHLSNFGSELLVDEIVNKILSKSF